VKHQKIFKQVYKLMMECILPPYLAVPCDILENILQVLLSGPSIKVLGITKEEQHKRKV
jgi:sulfopyruvate decarboxylase TPP-binding subunit